MTSITTTCRDISELLPVAQTACRLLFQECFKAGIKNIFITEHIAHRNDRSTFMHREELDQGRLLLGH